MSMVQLRAYFWISAFISQLHCFSARNTFPPATLPSYLQPPPYVGSWQNVNFPRTPQIPPPLSPVRPLLTCVTEHFRGDIVSLALNNAQGCLFGEFFCLNWPNQSKYELPDICWIGWDPVKYWVGHTGVFVSWAGANTIQMWGQLELWEPTEVSTIQILGQCLLVKDIVRCLII